MHLISISETGKKYLLIILFKNFKTFFNSIFMKSIKENVHTVKLCDCL